MTVACCATLATLVHTSVGLPWLAKATCKWLARCRGICGNLAARAVYKVAAFGIVRVVG